jgi:Ca2+/H+ antiporter
VTALVALGVVATLVGMGFVVIAIRHHAERLPKHTAMLIGGMMLTAFGIVIAGFVIVYQKSAPLAFNAAVPTP